MRAAVGTFLTAALLTASVAAQRPSDVVRWSAVAPQAQASAGGTVVLEVTADVQAGWHLYDVTQPKGGPNPLTFAVAKGSPYEVRVKEVKAPKPESKKDDNFNLQTRQHAGRVVFTVPVSIAPVASPGRQRIPLQVTFQACGNELCLRPFTQTLQVEVVVK